MFSVNIGDASMMVDTTKEMVKVTFNDEDTVGTALLGELLGIDLQYIKESKNVFMSAISITRDRDIVVMSWMEDEGKIHNRHFTNTLDTSINIEDVKDSQCKITFGDEKPTINVVSVNLKTQAERTIAVFDL